jgi:hypothetical protein
VGIVKAQTWTTPTPTSLAREKKSAANLGAADHDRRPGANLPTRPATVKQRPLTPQELADIEELSQGRLVRTAEQNDRHRTGADRRALQARPWLPPKDDAWTSPSTSAGTVTRTRS